MTSSVYGLIVGVLNLVRFRTFLEAIPSLFMFSRVRFNRYLVWDASLGCHGIEAGKGGG